MLEQREPRMRQFVVKATTAEDAVFVSLSRRLGVTKADLVRRCLTFALEHDRELADLVKDHRGETRGG